MQNNIVNAEFRTAETIIAEVKATIDHVETTAMLGAIKIGKCYAELKELIPHGGWYKYIEENTGHSPKKVERFMKIASEYGDESTPLGSLFSKTTISSDLGIYKALTLIALPDEEVDNFIEENDIASMTVKELEEKIKSLEEEKFASSERIETLEDDIEAGKIEQAVLEEQVAKLKDQLAVLEAAGADSDDGLSDEARIEIDKAKKDLGKAEKKAEASEKKMEKLQKDLDDLKASQEKIVQDAKAAAIEEGKQQGKMENEEELQKQKDIAAEAQEARLEAEKKLAASSDGDLMKVQFIINQINGLFTEALEAIENIEVSDKERAGRLRGGLHAILGQMQERL